MQFAKKKSKQRCIHPNAALLICIYTKKAKKIALNRFDTYTVEGYSVLLLSNIICLPPFPRILQKIVFCDCLTAPNPNLVSFNKYNSLSELLERPSRPTHLQSLPAPYSEAIYP
ncbi:MAG: hypothetical protein LIO54_05570 [Oscillospiraceae bacterium]|nr:hypothetical protein [Oscillospiraceae bacterium]